MTTPALTWEQSFKKEIYTEAQILWQKHTNTDFTEYVFSPEYNYGNVNLQEKYKQITELEKITLPNQQIIIDERKKEQATESKKANVLFIAGLVFILAAAILYALISPKACAITAVPVSLLLIAGFHFQSKSKKAGRVAEEIVKADIPRIKEGLAEEKAQYTDGLSTAKAELKNILDQFLKLVHKINPQPTDLQNLTVKHCKPSDAYLTIAGYITEKYSTDNPPHKNFWEYYVITHKLNNRSS